MHRALERQIKRYLGEKTKISSEWESLLEAMSQTYVHFDEDRNLLDHSLELSSKEFIELNKKLASEKEAVEKKVKERTIELEYEKKKLYEITQNMATGAILLDFSGRVVFINKAAEEIINYPRLEYENLEHEKVLNKFFETFPDKMVNALKMCIDGKPSDIPEAEYDGKIFHVLFQCIESENLTKEHLIWIEDITQSKKLERSKKEFVAIASHEMRTPLAIIRGQAELLLRHKATSLPKEMAEKIQSIYNSSIRLLYIVNDFLDITWLEEKRIVFKKESFDVIALIKEVVYDLKENADKKNLKLVFNEPSNYLPNTIADRERTRQVIMNLVANAIQYTNGGEITLSISQTGNYFLKIFVKDTGIGIELEKQSTLFQKFQIASKVFIKSREYGSGMGLYITQLLISQMGGEIKLEESQLGKGSTFSFTIPIAGSLPAI